MICTYLYRFYSPKFYMVRHSNRVDLIFKHVKNLRTFKVESQNFLDPFLAKPAS